MASVLAVGTVAFDSIETPFGRVEQVLGGSATYIGRAARYFSAPIRLSAVVGADFPEAYLERLRSSGMDLAGLRIDPEGETFAWGGRYHYDLNTRDTLYTHAILASGHFDGRASATPRWSAYGACLGATAIACAAVRSASAQLSFLTYAPRIFERIR
jgi:hypothetical protein